MPKDVTARDELRKACIHLGNAAILLNAGRARISFDDPMDYINARGELYETDGMFAGITIEVTQLTPPRNAEAIFVDQEIGG